MSQSTKLYAGVIVLAALGGAVYWAKTKDEKVGKSETTSAEFPNMPEEAIARGAVDRTATPAALGRLLGRMAARGRRASRL